MKEKVTGSKKAWVPALAAIIGLGGYLGLSEGQIADLQAQVPAVAGFAVIILQGFITYWTKNSS